MNSADAEGLAYRRVFGCLLATLWLTAIVVAIGLGGPLQVLFGLPLVLALPGTLIGYAVLPPESGIGGSLRFVLSLALSVVVALGVGLALALAFDEVSRAAAAACLTCVGTVAGVCALSRLDGSKTVSIPTALPVPISVLAVSGLLLVACVAIAVAALNVTDLPGHFTALTVTRSGDGARVEVRSHEGHLVRYRYVARDEDEEVFRSGSILIDGGAVHTLELPVPRATHEISVALYDGSRQPYRLVTLRGLN